MCQCRFLRVAGANPRAWQSTGRLRAFQILINRAVSDRATAGDLSLPQSHLVSESQDFFELSHGQPFRGQCGVPPLPVEPYCPRCCPASLALWKSLRNDPGQGSDPWPELTGLKSESVTDFIPES